MYGVIVNDIKYETRNITDVMVYLFMVLSRHALYSPLPIIKENIIEACSLLTELCKLDTANKHIVMKRRIARVIKFTVGKKTNEDIHRMLFDSILAFEGHGLLPGFQYGSLSHKGDKPRGNAERKSILK
jgi:hypothetical protein